MTANETAENAPGSWHRVDPDDLPDEGRVGSLVVDGRPVALTRCGGRLGGLENRCPHKGGPLSEGIVHGGSVTCPLHNWVFDLATGEAQGADEGQVRTFAVEVVEGRIFMAADIMLAAAE